MTEDSLWSRRTAALVVALAVAAGACTSSSEGSGAPAAPTDGPATTTATAETTTTTTAYAPTWSAIHADGRNSDFAPIPGPDALEPAWSYATGGMITVGPTSDPDGRVYLTDNGGPCHLQALDGATGEVEWCTEELDLGAAISSALIDREGHVFVADSQALHAFDRDGALLWEAPIVGVPLSAQLTPAGSVVLVTNIGQVHVVDRATGEPVVPVRELIPGRRFTLAESLWPCARGLPGCPSANTIAVHPDTGRVFFTWWEPGAPRASVRAIDIDEDEGAITDAWSNDGLPNGSGSSPTVSADGTRVYVTDGVDSLHALDADTGAIIWSYRIGWNAGGSPSVSPDGLVMPAGAGGTVAVVDEGDRAVPAWQRDDLVNLGIATQAEGHRAYVTVPREGREVDIAVVDTRDGTVLDRDRLEGVSLFSVGTTLTPDGTVLVPTFAGTLHAYRPAR
ncbi:PQQ-binding-like beta-propeller repeat protein [Iamia sp. SCSIO 61187]|uniref:outer membrane protein assembly factor BamB family protein n=1 Tax=Iamia sp. SCSIO 61187 TaxID=2722752 RepID=UPI001C636C4E|nr:PQQ-binding-like beta-propeller repeat protein [Iamia sp. SCSIO 61187]QYG92498.1 PQQ-binding-like beta-propeller repeat protein [Iamia sp. SCSIO 61187]